MRAILESWLRNKVSVIVDFNEIDHALMDGTLFIRILKHYNVINVSSIRNVFPSDDRNVCKNNLVQLKIWFKLIDVKFDDDDIDKILEGNTTVCYNVLYQLFLVLRKADMHLLTKQKERKTIEECEKRFKAQPAVITSRKQTLGRTLTQEYYDKILKKKKIIDWQLDKLQLKDKKVRSCSHLYSNLEIASSELIELNGINKSHIAKNKSVLAELQPPRSHSEDYNYVKYELCKFDKRSALNESAFESCGDNLFFNKHPEHNFLPPISPKRVSETVTVLAPHLKEFIGRVKTSSGMLCKRQTNKSFGASVLNDSWKHLVDYEKTQLKGVISCRLIKQSHYERDVSLKFVSIIGNEKMYKQFFMEFENRISKAKKTSSSSVIVRNIPDCFNKGTNTSREDWYDNKFTSSYLNGPGQRYIDVDYEAYCLNERKRTVELHRKLYAEKLKLQFDRHYAVCLHTIVDITNLAIRCAEFRNEYERDVPPYIWEKWKRLFYHELPIFDIITEVEGYLFPENANLYEVILERMRQEVLNDVDLEHYLEVTDSWDLFDAESANNDYSNSKCKILRETQTLLGYIVHKILKSKYPTQPLQTPAEIATYPVAAIVNCIDDMEAINRFRNLLSKANILVVDVNTAVNFCLQYYKSVSETSNVQVQGDYQSSSSLDEQRSMNFDRKSEMAFYSKYTQTTNPHSDSIIMNPFDELVRLGRSVFKSMVTGKELPFATLVEIMIEYIKHHQDGIKGWVAVNVPSSLYQASILEYALSGRKFPYSLEDDTASLGSSDYKVSGTTKEFHLSESVLSYLGSEVSSSRIVPNPESDEEIDAFKSYFSMYITTVKGSQLKETSVTHPSEFGSVNGDQGGSTLLLEQPEREGVPTLYNFYNDYGIGYNFIYEEFDSNTLKQLAYMILLYFVEDSRIEKFPEYFFSEDILNEFEPSVLLKFYQSTSDVSSLYKSMKGGSFMTYEESVNYHHESMSMDVITEESYVDNPILENAMLALASVWQNLENVYLKTYKEVSLLKRALFYTSAPHIVIIHRMVKSYWNREDDRQRLVSEYLDGYNSIYLVLRSDHEMINELHLRVVQLKEKLIAICKEKKQDIKELCKAIRVEDYLFLDLSLFTLYNECISQAEIDRYIRTINFLQDYYLAMLGTYNSQPIPTVTAPTFNVYVNIKKDFDDSESLESLGKRSTVNDEKGYRFYLQFMAAQHNDVNSSTHMFYQVIEEYEDILLNKILKGKDRIKKMINNEEVVALKKHKAFINSKYDLPKGSSENKNSPSATELLGISKEIEASEGKEAIKKLFTEWRRAFDTEYDRCLGRMKLINRKFLSDINRIKEFYINKVVELYSLIGERYENEKICIEYLCMFLQTAIEEHTPINGKIIFDKDNFYIIKDPEEPEELDVIVPSTLEEMLSEDSFTIKQLEAMRLELLVVAPEGVINQVAFMTFLENITSYSYNRDNVKLVPNIWRGLSKQEIKILCFELFGDFSIIEWRDFLIYCLDLPYPLTEDIVDARLQFLKYDLKETELISHEGYMKTTLWFQRELPVNPLQALRNVLAKAFLFELFKRPNNSINYMALLLAFCKDIDPKIGFGKALSLIVGKCIIVYKVDLFLEEILIDNVDTGLKVVKEIMNEVLDDVIENTMSSGHDNASMSLNEMPSFNVKSDLSLAVHNDSHTLLTEKKYHQLFRRHLFLRWSSTVPNAVITSLLYVVFYTMDLPDNVYLYSNLLRKIENLMSKFKDEDVNVPDFVDSRMLNLILNNINKFFAVSVKDLIKEIIAKRKK